jgi:hypothetical protein
MSTPKLLGLKSAHDLAGARVRLTREARNGFHILPCGSVGFIPKNRQVRNGYIELIADRCSSCGSQVCIRGLRYENLELVDQGNQAGPDMKVGATDRETIDLNGWAVGDILEGQQLGKPARILITALGEETFLCRWDYSCSGIYDEECGSTVLTEREWRKIGSKTDRKTF